LSPAVFLRPDSLMLELEALPRSDRIPIEAECLCPDKLAGLSLPEIERLPVYQGNRQRCLADFFTIAGTASDGKVRVLGDCSSVKRLGSGMSDGQLLVDGNAGMHLGAEMSGGVIEVRGDADEWAGAEMKGGRIHIRGNAADRLGSAYVGSKIGMTGGTILVEGNAGHEVGAAMRRGLIAIGGNAGDFAGASMIAGSVLIFGSPGQRLGAGMKRGSIVLMKSGPLRLLPTFRFACEIEPTFIALYFRKLRDWGFCRSEPPFLSRRFRLYRGDLTELGKGEIFHNPNE
jgi:formylmethanofuran dehydrogenase subunit C